MLPRYCSRWYRPFGQCLPLVLWHPILFQYKNLKAIQWYITRLVLDYFALSSTSDAACSSLVSRFQRSGDLTCSLRTSAHPCVWTCCCLIHGVRVQSASALQVLGVGVDCEAPHLRSILRFLRVGFFPACFFNVSGWASVKVSPLACSGVMICSTFPLITPGRRYHLRGGWFSCPLSRTTAGEQATNRSNYIPLNTLCEWRQQSRKHPSISVVGL